MLLTVLTWLGVAAAALFVGWPLLRAERDDPGRSGDATGPLERQKREALAAIKDAELDHAMGKLSDEDFASQTQRYRDLALAAMAQLNRAPDAGRAERPGRLAFCPQCGGKLAAAANFCSRCGAALRPRAA